MKLASGTPFSVTDSSVTRDLDFDGFADSIRPVILDRSIIGTHLSSPDTSQQALPRSAFRSADFSDSIDSIVPRNAFYTPGTRSVDLALSKTFLTPWTSQTAAVRIEAFNAFNMVKFGFPTSDIASVNFGRLLLPANSYSPRVVQLVLRYRY